VALNGSAGEGSALTRDLEAPVPADALKEAEGVEIGPPLSISLEDGELPAAGATISRRLREPVSPGARASLAYYDEEHEAWIAVPTQIARDRRTLTATVHHFSLWDSITYGAGWLLDTRVGAPTCEGSRPDWLPDVVALDDRNAPLRWCTGHDPRRPDVLVVKARMNRSYGVRLVPSVPPEWMYDGLFQSGPQGFLVDAAVRLSQAFDQPPVKRGETILLGGEEVDYGFTERQVRSLAGPVLIRARLDKPEAVAGLTFTALNKLAGDEGRVGQQIAAVVTLVGLAQCATDIRAPLAQGDFVGAGRAAFKCLETNSDDFSRALARALAQALPNADPKLLGRISGKIGGKLWQVWSAGEAFQIGTLLADSRLLHNAFELHAFPKPIARPAPDLSRAQLNSEGIGPVKLGMTAGDVRKLGIRLRISEGPYCDTWLLPGAEDVQLFAPHSSGELESVGIWKPSPHAPRGVQPGDAADELGAAYGDELEVISSDSLGMDFYRLYSASRETTLQFSFDRSSGELGGIEVGLPGQFYYPDGTELCA